MKLTFSFSLIGITAISLYCSIVLGQTGNSHSEIEHQLSKIPKGLNVLYIAAHPDDENTRLISYLANEKCFRTAYLSLTRGDGGQNLIGPEQGIELGVIRTQELLAARRTDGGEQSFTRAYDFGYSKTPSETFDKWNHDSILSDVVYVIRKFKPDVIITRFATDGSGGHGHHTASAILAEEAFDAAANPNRFPEQLNEVSVWQTKRLFYNSAARFWNPNADMSGFIKLDVGGYNHLLGKSYGEIAAESRSMHRSQGFGSAKQRGELFEYFKPLKGDTGSLTGLFDRLDANWKCTHNSKKISKLLADASKSFSDGKIGQCNDFLLESLSLIPDDNQDEHAYKRRQIQKAILQVNGIFLEATAEGSPLAALGDSLKIKIVGINRLNTPVMLNKISLHEIGINKLCEAKNVDSLLAFPMANNVAKIIYLNRLVCQQNTSGELFWLANEIQNNKFQINQNKIALPYSLNSGYAAHFFISIQGKMVQWQEPVQYKFTDPEKGEKYRPLVLIPPVLVQALTPVLVCNDTNWKEIKIKVKAGKDKVQGKVVAVNPNNWPVSNGENQTRKTTGAFCEIPFAIDKKGEEKELSFWMKPPIENSSDKVSFEIAYEGNTYKQGLKEISYDHIPTQTLFPVADIQVVKLDAKITSKRIGYIPGAGDEVQACLTQLGYEVITLTDAMLANSNLQSFETIITGVRAYNTNDKLSLNKKKLMDYVANGGNLIVQYNTNSFAGPFKGDLGPYPFKISRERITDEQAKVEFNIPNHPVLNLPNKITEKDFDGWIQERSIYHAGDIDPHYETPLSMNDPGEKPNKGSLIIGAYGKGYFVYTGLAFFRELPAGVPGAYRLMVNLIELGR